MTNYFPIALFLCATEHTRGLFACLVACSSFVTAVTIHILLVRISEIATFSHARTLVVIYFNTVVLVFRFCLQGAVGGNTTFHRMCLIGIPPMTHPRLQRDCKVMLLRYYVTNGEGLLLDDTINSKTTCNTPSTVRSVVTTHQNSLH